MLLPIVNEKDEIVGQVNKEDHYKGANMLRSVQIFVYNSAGQLFVQKRAKNKKRFPSYFCSSEAGHVDPGENYDQALIRETKEELGIDLKEYNFISKERTFVGKKYYAMMAHYTAISDDPITLQEEEVESGAFYDIEEVKEMMKNNPFTPSFIFLFNKLH
jgi:isopentenyl-diphosphate Delta-isomerase